MERAHMHSRVPAIQIPCAKARREGSSERSVGWSWKRERGDIHTKPDHAIIKDRAQVVAIISVFRFRV